jgi:hypothetical protein
LSGVLRGEGVSRTLTTAVPEEMSTQLQAKQSKQPIPPSGLTEPNTVDKKEPKERGHNGSLQAKATHVTMDHDPSRRKSAGQQRPKRLWVAVGLVLLSTLALLWPTSALVRQGVCQTGSDQSLSEPQQRSRPQHFASRQALCRGTRIRQRRAGLLTRRWSLEAGAVSSTGSCRHAGVPTSGGDEVRYSRALDAGVSWR